MTDEDKSTAKSGTSDVSKLIDRLFEIGKDLDPTTGEDKQVFEGISASVAAQRAAIAGFRR